MKENYKDFEHKFSKEYIRELFEKFEHKSDLLTYLGIRGWANGERLLKKLASKIGEPLTKFYPTNKDKRSLYESNPVKCLQCGKSLSYEHRHEKFCSHSCSATYNNSRREKKVKYCVNCGKPLQNKQTKYCCKDCENKVRYKRIEYDNIDKWLGGENFIYKGAQVPLFIRRYLMSLHNNKCQLCGWGEMNVYSHTIPLEIHHIDGDCTNNRLENLQLLCPNCHSLTETNGSLNKNSKRFHKSRLTGDIE